METESDGLRIIPGDWTEPLPIEVLRGKEAVPFEVDIGCGKGRFLLTRAEAFPHTRFLGVDRSLCRVLTVERRARRRALRNVRVMYVDACYAVTYLFPPACVSAYYLFFPDPWPKRRHHRRRLFDDLFIESLHRTFVPGGCFHVATDHRDYFDVIRRSLGRDARFEAIAPFEPTEAERTNFELLFLAQGKEIYRCSYQWMRGRLSNAQ